MPVLVTKTAPDFTAAALFHGKEISEFTLSAWKGKYVFLLFYPMDFSFLCPSEIFAFNKRLNEFHDRNCQLAAISTDTEYTHLAWCTVPPEKGGAGEIKFPLIADKTKNLLLPRPELHSNLNPSSPASSI